MIHSSDIIEALCLLGGGLPEFPQVYDVLPQQPQTPCLLVEPVAAETSSANANLVYVAQYFTLTVIPDKNLSPEGAARTVRNLQGILLGLLRNGYLHVKDRCIPVTATLGGTEEGKTFIDLQMEYYDARVDPKDQLPMMEEVKAKLINERMKQ